MLASDIPALREVGAAAITYWPVADISRLEDGSGPSPASRSRGGSNHRETAHAICNISHGNAMQRSSPMRTND